MSGDLSPCGDVFSQEELFVPEVSKEVPGEGSFECVRRGISLGGCSTDCPVCPQHKSSVSLPVICSRPPHRAQELEQLHMETRAGDGEALWDPQPL